MTTKLLFVSRICIVLFLFTLASPLQADTYEVIVANHPDLPALTKDQVDQVLSRSVSIIEKAYGKKIIFKITEELDFFKLAQKERSEFGKYKPNPEWFFSLYDDSISRFKNNILKTCKDYGTLDALNQFIEPRTPFKDYQTVANHLQETYLDRLGTIKKIQTNKNKPLITKSNWEDFTFTYWFQYIQAKPYAKKSYLYLTNILLIDTDLYYAPPHTLLRGGLTNGFTNIPSRTVFLATGPILYDHPLINKMRDGSLNIEQKLLAISNIVGHEIGAHLIQNYTDNYDHNNCLSVPPSGLKYLKYNKALSGNLYCNKDHESPYFTYPGKNQLLAEIASRNGKVGEMVKNLTKKISSKNISKHSVNDYDSLGWAYLFGNQHNHAFQIFQQVANFDQRYENNYIHVFGYKDKSQLPWNKNNIKNDGDQ